MATSEQNEYILGTDEAELHRLGLQHQIWASEAHLGWTKAGFNVGETILDLGCGPGFCAKELAYIVGKKGRVIGVDKSHNYIQFLQKTAALHAINIDAIHSDFNDLKLSANSLDAMYCRWALAWIGNPKEILNKVFTALKPGGKMVIQEYFDWSTHQTQPSTGTLSKAIAMCLKSFKEQEGDIDVGREIPAMLETMGMKIESTRIIAKLANPKELTWQWPKSFYQVYFPRLVEMNYLTQQESDQALTDMYQLEKTASSQLFCPSVIEIIAGKQ